MVEKTIKIMDKKTFRNIFIEKLGKPDSEKYLDK